MAEENQGYTKCWGVKKTSDSKAPKAPKGLPPEKPKEKNRMTWRDPHTQVVHLLEVQAFKIAQLMTEAKQYGRGRIDPYLAKVAEAYRTPAWEAMQALREATANATPLTKDSTKCEKCQGTLYLHAEPMAVAGVLQSHQVRCACDELAKNPKLPPTMASYSEMKLAGYKVYTNDPFTFGMGEWNEA